jgi:hypothetical protein
MIDKILLKSLLEEKEAINQEYKAFSDKCADFDARLCQCLGVPKGTAITHDDIIEVLLDEVQNDNE